MEISARTDIGTKRKNNQDNYFLMRTLVNDVETTIACVCDGMGGLADGYLASAMVINKLRNFFQQDCSVDGCRDVLDEANKAVFLAGKDKGAMMGTTCSIIVLSNGKYWGFHVGDSRIYQLKDNENICITTDHTAVNKLGMKPDNPEYHKYVNKLTRCIGAVEYVNFDFLSGSYEESDKFLLCSDGFWHWQEDKLTKNINLIKAIEDCKNNGETDNITVLEVTCVKKS